MLRCREQGVRTVTGMNRSLPITALAGLVLGSALTLLTPSSVSAKPSQYVTGLASSLPGAVAPAVDGPATHAFVSGNGRFVAFSSTARLVADDVDTVADVYVKDLLTESVERINATTDAAAASAPSTPTAITPDGRYVVFWSAASNLVTGDGGGKRDVFRRDRHLGTTMRLSGGSAGWANGDSPADPSSDQMAITTDGTSVAFSSTATNLGPDADSKADVFVRNIGASTTTLVSVADNESIGNAISYQPSITNNGRYVSFTSSASNLVAGDTNASSDVFLRDLIGSTTIRVSLTDADTQAAGASYNGGIDGYGYSIVFSSSASGLASGDANSVSDIYRRDLAVGSTKLVSVPAHDGPANGHSGSPVISHDGGTIAFHSLATNLAAGNGNAVHQIHVRTGSTTTRVSVSTAGTLGNQPSLRPSVSDANDRGTVVAFESDATNLVAGDSEDGSIFTRRQLELGAATTVGGFADDALERFDGTVDTAAYAAMVARLERGASPSHELIGLADGPYAAKHGPLARLYTAYFARMPDPSGFTYWLNKLTTGTKKLDQVSAQFAASNEFKTKYGNTTNTEFVKLVYTNVLDRQPDAGGLAYWVKKLDNGFARGTVMTSFSESNEGKRHFAPQVRTVLLGLAYFGSVPQGQKAQNFLYAMDTAGAPEGGSAWLLETLGMA